ncbi:MAG: TVP38/TMEM64 family protein [Roseococcus sp.]
MRGRIALLLAFVLLLVGLRLAGVEDLLSLEALARRREALLALVARDPALAALGYVLVYALAVAVSLPGAAILTLAGGFLFGAGAGTALAVLGATLGATGAFLFARLLLGAAALERLGPRAQALAAAVRRDAASYLLMLRLVPLFPFVLVNLVPALVGVRLPLYLATTFLGIIPGTAVFALTGAGLGEALEGGGGLDAARLLSPAMLAGLTGLGLLALAAIPLRRRLARR